MMKMMKMGKMKKMKKRACAIGSSCCCCCESGNPHASRGGEWERIRDQFGAIRVSGSPTRFSLTRSPHVSRVREWWLRVFS